jgi:MFS transporter, PAT family, beta-lactamase induction signal transducer AmpG
MAKTVINHATGLFYKRPFPTLSDHTFLRYFSFVALYVAQGIPEGMTYFGIPAWMAMNGKSPAEIGGYVAVIGIPWTFKIVVAPLMDRFTFLAMGRRRPWVIFGQLGLIASFISMAMVPDPLNHLFLLKLAAFFVSFFGAFQDVATDGMAIDVVPVNEQARANGLMWGSKTIGTSVSLTTGTWLINQYSFSVAILSLSIGVVFIMMVPLLMRERPGEKFLPWTKGVISPAASIMQLDSWKTIFKSLFKVFFLPGSFLFGIAVFFIHVAFGLMDTLLPVFTIQGAGWTDSKYAQVFASCNIIAGVLGMVAGGALADFLGKKRMMTIYLVGIIALVVTMSLAKAWWGTSWLIAVFIGIYYTLYVFLTVSIFATGMSLCWGRVAATQFTLYMAIANLARATGSGLLGPLKSAMTWEYVILSTAAFAIAMLVIVQLLRLQKHKGQVEILELKHLENEKCPDLIGVAISVKN